MSVKFETVLDGTAKYIDKEIMPHLADWQEIFARMAIGRIFERREVIKTALINNGIFRTFGVIDEKGNVDIDGLLQDLKNEISKKQKLTVEIPLFGTMTFRPTDVDKLLSYIDTDKGEDIT